MWLAHFKQLSMYGYLHIKLNFEIHITAWIKLCISWAITELESGVVDKTVKLRGNVWVLFRHFKKLCNRNLVCDDSFFFKQRICKFAGSLFP